MSKGIIFTSDELREMLERAEAKNKDLMAEVADLQVDVEAAKREAEDSNWNVERCEEELESYQAIIDAAYQYTRTHDESPDNPALIQHDYDALKVALEMRTP